MVNLENGNGAGARNYRIAGNFGGLAVGVETAKLKYANIVGRTRNA